MDTQQVKHDFEAITDTMKIMGVWGGDIAVIERVAYDVELFLLQDDSYNYDDSQADDDEDEETTVFGEAKARVFRNVIEMAGAMKHTGMLHRFQEYAYSVLPDPLYHKFIFVPQVKHDLRFVFDYMLQTFSWGVEGGDAELLLTFNVSLIELIDGFKNALIESKTLPSYIDGKVIIDAVEDCGRPLLLTRLVGYVNVVTPTPPLGIPVIPGEPCVLPDIDDDDSSGLLLISLLYSGTEVIKFEAH